MTDNEFLEELVARLNDFLEADPNRANVTLCTPLKHAGYASVAHFVGQLAMPRKITKDASADEVLNVKFVTPVVEDQKIVCFEAVSGAELQKRHEATMATQSLIVDPSKTH